MPQYIIQHNNVFNVYTTVSDGCYFESGLTLEQLKWWYESEYGKSGMAGLDKRIERAMMTGTSYLGGDTLKQCVSVNRAGPNESRIPYEEFILTYLTIRD